MSKKAKVGFVSLGCSKNLVDTETMLARLSAAGYEITPEETEADVVVINTCAFIESAKKESIENILDIAWLKEHKKLKGIIVTGCLAERYRSEIFSELPEVDALLGVGGEEKIVEAVDAVLAKEKFSDFSDKEKSVLGGNRIVTTPEYTAYLKIAEGCDNRCTYCAIPLIRGGFRSRKMEDIIAEAKELEALGVKELNLIAQDTSRYGLDIYGEYKLAELAHKITEETNIPWIRLLYCYPDKITDELIAEIRDNKRIVKYLDIPVQHISDNMLTAMNRHGGSALIRDTIARVRAAIPDITLRTTVIVGFPGETEKDFDELCEFVKETKFDRLGAFTYSREEDTPAYDLPDQVDEQTKQDRYDIIMKEQMHIAAEKNENFIGKKVRVLAEAYDQVAEIYYGRGQGDAPDIDTKIYFSNPAGAPRIKPGEFVTVRIESTVDYDLVGVAIR
ncbi:MAG: 30S ribosomal protein S12 methylthiotransferase RimO [Clostridiales bacterium]|nr:30S ribosomal protein S12 methylthiotransferase RimO [Clostridiales bacterium]